MTHTIRNSKMAKIISLISESGIMEDIMKDFEKSKGSFNMKDMLLNSLSPKGHEAFKLAFQMIENEYYILIEHEDNDIHENWFTHFVEYHDVVIRKLKEGGDAIFKYAIREFGNDFINDVYRQDARSLEEIIDIVGKHYIEAKGLKEQRDNKLKEKLHTQLQDVVATLKDIAGDDTVNGFEIHTKDASFKIKTNSNEEAHECTCGQCGEGGDLEELLKKFFGGLSK